MAPKSHAKEPSYYQLADGIRTTSGVDGGTVLDIAGNRIFRLNEVGELILHCVQEGWNEARIASHISRQYSVDEGQSKRDVHEFLEVLNERRLLDATTRPEKR
ncbi:MAG TPA: PqqD family protein [Terriglobales bacterium]|jgi:hypothetical protein|nr:PqqD family protein [Terriglobales bacterium]